MNNYFDRYKDQQFLDNLGFDTYFEGETYQGVIKAQYSLNRANEEYNNRRR